MACKITRQQVRTAILDQAFNEMFEGRNTFSRLSDDTIQINNKADNAKTKAQSKEQAYNIAQERLESIRTSFNGKVDGYVHEISPYEPITISLSVRPDYIEYEYSNLNPINKAEDPGDFYMGDQALKEQEERELMYQLTDNISENEINNIIENEVTYTDEENKPCAKDGIRSSKFTKGSQWEIVKDLKGYPSHAQGGVDIKLGKDGFSFTGKDGEIKAANGLVLPKIK